MHIYSLRLFKMDDNIALLIATAQDLSILPFIMRYSKSSTELFLFLSRTLIENTNKCDRKGCEEGEYIGWSYYNKVGIGAVIITDKEYSRRVSFELLDKAITMYINNSVNWAWKTVDKDISHSLLNKDLQELITKYQNPLEIDKILVINKELDNTRTVLYKSIDSMLERGEKIDKLVEKSNDLSFQSKKFYRKSKKINSWCNNCIIS